MEGDDETARSMELMMRAENFNVYVTDLGVEGIELAMLYEYDLITLNLSLPDMSGYEVLIALRSRHIDTPIIIVSDETDVATKVKGLRLGADDYLAKPFHPDELIARLGALARRSKALSLTHVVIGNLVYDFTTKVVTVSNTRVPLRKSEYRILELLVLRRGSIVSKQQFLDYLYADEKKRKPKKSVIDVFIMRLRKKLGSPARSGNSIIRMVSGRGYTLREPEEHG